MARGDECEPAKVAKLKKDGNAAFGAGNLEEALGAYDKAYACDKDASLLFNISKANAKLGHYLEALDAMRRFKHDSQNLPKEIVDAADATMAELAGKVGTLSVRSNVEGATVTVGDRELGRAPLRDVEVSAGKLTVRVRAPGKPDLVRTVQIEGGKHGDVDATFDREQASPDVATTEPAKRPAFHPSPLLFVGAGVAGAGLLVGIGTGAASLAKTSEIKKSCPANKCPASLDADRSKANTLANVSNVSLAVAAAGAIVGAIGLGLSFKHEDTTVNASLGPLGAGVSGSF